MDVVEDDDVVEDTVVVETVVEEDVVVTEVDVVEGGSVDADEVASEEVELDERVDEDDAVRIGVTSVVETRVEGEVSERIDAKSGENWRANTKIAIRVKALRTRIFLSAFT